MVKKILDNSLSSGKDFANMAGKKVLTKRQKQLVI